MTVFGTLRNFFVLRYDSGSFMFVKSSAISDPAMQNRTWYAESDRDLALERDFFGLKHMQEQVLYTKLDAIALAS